MTSGKRFGPPSHAVAIGQAIFVTFLWSTSWVLIKVGLQASIPALTFAGLRYTLAFLCLCPFVLLKREQRAILRALSPSGWGRLALLGVLFYALTQGAQFLSLALLPATMVNLLLNLTPALVALAGGVLLREHLTYTQWLGIVLSVVGVGIYFWPFVLLDAHAIGLGVAVVGVLANAASSVLGRQVNRQSRLSPLLVTFVSMGVGALLLLVTGAVTQGFGLLGWRNWAIILWLAVVNTAFAFTLWNSSLRTLSAVQSCTINSLMLPQVAVLAVVFVGETLTGREALGLALVGLAVLIVSVGRQSEGISRRQEAIKGSTTRDTH